MSLMTLALAGGFFTTSTTWEAPDPNILGRYFVPISKWPLAQALTHPSGQGPSPGPCGHCPNLASSLANSFPMGTACWLPL